MENEAEKKEATADKQVPEEHNTEVQNSQQSTDQPSTEEPSPSNPPQPEKEYNPKFINPEFYTRINKFQDEFSSKMNELSKSDSYGKDDDKMKNVYRSLFILMTLVYCRIL